MFGKKCNQKQKKNYMKRNKNHKTGIRQFERVFIHIEIMEFYLALVHIQIMNS